MRSREKRGVDRPGADEQAIMRCSQLERDLDIAHCWYIWEYIKQLPEPDPPLDLTFLKSKKPEMV
ncbi:MAG: hypothetical protein ACFFER_18000 [Candidatus Thorarchaeota archaeon]